MNRAPTTTPTDAALERAAEIAREFVAGLPDRPVRADRAAGRAPAPVRRAAARTRARTRSTSSRPWRPTPRAASIATAGPRFFGFVIGGGLPAALAADWLTSAWDQNAGLYVIGPAAAVAEEVAGAWLADLFGLPAGVERRASRPARRWPRSPGIAAARHALLARPGLGRRAPGPVRGARDPGRRERRVARHDLRGPPDAGHGPGARDPGRDRRPGPDAGRRAARGARRARPAGARVRAGGQREHRRLRPAAARSSRRSAPTAAGCTSTARSGCGRPPIPRGATSSRGSGTPTRGRPTPTSGSTCPTTRGLSFVADPAAHHAAMTLGAAYYVETTGGERDNYNWVPESSRRARGFASGRRSVSSAGRGWREMIGRDVGPRSAVRGRARRRARDPRPQRRRPQPGARPVRGPVGRRRGRRRPDRRRDRRDPGRRDAVAGRHAAGTACARCGSRSPAGRRRRPTWTRRWP